MQRLFVALMATTFFTTGVALSKVDNTTTRPNTQHNGTFHGATPTPKPTRSSHRQPLVSHRSPTPKPTHKP